MYQNRLPQQCACFVRVNPIGTKHFILTKVFVQNAFWSKKDTSGISYFSPNSKCMWRSSGFIGSACAIYVYSGAVYTLCILCVYYMYTLVLSVSSVLFPAHCACTLLMDTFQLTC